MYKSKGAMMDELNILKDDLGKFSNHSSAFVTFGEAMVRDTPADLERPERTRQVYISLAGSELTLVMMLARLGIPSTYITRVPDNPYGWLVRDTARSQGINADYFVWAEKTEPIGRFIYEIGRTPRKNIGWYQRKYSAASRLGRGMVDWKEVLKECLLFHTSGITFGLASHSGYENNHLLEAFNEAVKLKPNECKIGLDFNYRSTLWDPKACRDVMTPLVNEHVDILITTIEDMAEIYGIGCGKYSARDIVNGEMGDLSDEDLVDFTNKVMERFNTQIVAVTIRYPDCFEKHRWESAVMDNEGNFSRSAEISSITLNDRLGGGDTWNGGFYYGLLSEGFNPRGMRKGVVVGDAATRIKQTLMFDMPIVTKREIQSLIDVPTKGGGKRTVR